MFESFKKPALALALALGSIAAAHAEGLYVGGNLGSPDYHDSVNGIDGNGGGVAGKLYGGYQFNPYFGVEAGGFSLGHLDNGQGRVNLRGVYADAVGTYPIASQWSLIGRGGFAEGHFNTTNGDDSSPALKLGLGVQYDVSKQIGIRAEYERYHFVNAFDDKVNAGTFSVGLKYAF